MKTIFASFKWSSAARAIARCALCTGSKVPPRMPAFNSSPSGADLAVAEDDVLLGGQALEADRAARVQLVGRDADFGAQSVLVTVGEARGGVPHDRARVDLAQKPLGSRAVAGDDGIGMLRAVLRDVLDRFVEALYHADGDDGCKPFGVVVVLRGFPAFDVLQGGGVGAHFDVLR